MKSVYRGLLVCLLGLVPANQAKAEVSVTQTEVSLVDQLGPIQNWKSSEGRVSSVDVGQVTPLTFDWFQEVVSALNPDFSDVILDAGYGVVNEGNVSCAYGTAESGKNSAVWSLCVYQVDGVKFYVTNSVTLAKGKLADAQKEVIQYYLGLGLRGALSLPTEPITGIK